MRKRYQQLMSSLSSMASASGSTHRALSSCCPRPSRHPTQPTPARLSMHRASLHAPMRPARHPRWGGMQPRRPSRPRPRPRLPCRRRPRLQPRGLARGSPQGPTQQSTRHPTLPLLSSERMEHSVPVCPVQRPRWGGAVLCRPSRPRPRPRCRLRRRPRRPPRGLAGHSLRVPTGSLTSVLARRLTQTCSSLRIGAQPNAFARLQSRPRPRPHMRDASHLTMARLCVHSASAQRRGTRPQP